jgi:hypothetical protein
MISEVSTYELPRLDFFNSRQLLGDFLKKDSENWRCVNNWAHRLQNSGAVFQG